MNCRQHTKPNTVPPEGPVPGVLCSMCPSRQSPEASRGLPRVQLLLVSSPVPAYPVDHPRDGRACFPGRWKLVPFLCKIGFQDGIPGSKGEKKHIHHTAPHWQKEGLTGELGGGKKNLLFTITPICPLKPPPQNQDCCPVFSAERASEGGDTSPKETEKEGIQALGEGGAQTRPQ